MTEKQKEPIIFGLVAGIVFVSIVGIVSGVWLGHGSGYKAGIENGVKAGYREGFKTGMYQTFAYSDDVNRGMTEAKDFETDDEWTDFLVGYRPALKED
jgi:hypothetical protein